jgi:hypothetical protein
MRFGEWPGFQGLRFVMLWVVLVFVVFGWRYYWGMDAAVAEETTRPTFRLGAPLLVAFGPPIVLAIVFGIVRRSRRP